MENFSSTPIPKSTPRDVFMHLLSTVTLYVSVVSFITLAFQYINVWFPDVLNFYYQSILDSIRWSASALLVMFIVYVFMTWLINRDFAKNPTIKEIKIRKWLVYLTLFAASITIIIDVITLIYNFLGGELTLNFFLKILIVLFVVAAVFGYYFWDLHRGGAGGNKLKIFAFATSLVVLITIVGGFFIVGSPAEQRMMRFDEQRINDLQVIQSEVVNYWTQKEVLPPTLNELNNSISGFVPPSDPETNTVYEYNIKSNLIFELCAEFNLPSLVNNTTVNSVPTMPRSVYDPYNQNWSHGKGRTCFERTIDPELYKLKNQLK
jgi:hypothetical protein